MLEFVVESDSRRLTHACAHMFCASMRQVLVNWGDWTSVEDIWVTTSPRMMPNTAVFENWDRLYLTTPLDACVSVVNALDMSDLSGI